MTESRFQPNQLRLFNEPGLSGLVSPAPVPDSLAALSVRLPCNLYLGTCSWSFPGWAGIVYGNTVSKSTLARQGLVAYSRHPLLRCVEIDRTFYSKLQAQDYAAYAAQVPAEFCFIVKAHQDSTVSAFPKSGFFGRQRAGQQNPFFMDPVYACERLIAPFAEGLKGKGIALLFQFPPLERSVVGNPRVFAERLHNFLRRLPKPPRYAVELRNPSFLCQEYFQALRDLDVTHCLNAHPRMPGVGRQRELAGEPYGMVLVRWMLHSGMSYEEARVRHQPFDRLVDPDPGVRKEILGICHEALRRQLPVYLLANNKAEGSAPLTLFNLARALLLSKTQPGGAGEGESD